MSDAALVEAYLEAASIEDAASDNTLVAYRADLDLYLSFLAGRGRGLWFRLPNVGPWPRL